MRSHDLFQPADLEALDGLLSKALLVVPMEDIYDECHADDILHGTHVFPRLIGMRHDCDNVILPAVEMAKWESDHGYCSTYYILHTSPYWQDKTLLRSSLYEIAYCGHEIGIHNDAITVALETGRDPADILFEAIEELRGYGHEIRSTVAHGHHLCRVANYVNDEMFLGCARSDYGDPDRTLEHNGRKVKLRPTPLGTFGLDFDSNWLPRGDYLSDSGGHWSRPFAEAAAEFPSKGQLHMLVHPDWWSQAFAPSKVAA